jgi:hypothetical protein
MSDELPPERTVARLRYLNTPTSNWAADRIEELAKPKCEMCGTAEAEIVECRDCNHWANMED